MTIQDAMKELHTLGNKIAAGIPESKFGPKERLELLKGGIVEMLERHSFPKDISLQDSRLSPAACKVWVSCTHLNLMTC
jgi:hypothetical protein